jgi:hypothetical protein
MRKKRPFASVMQAVLIVLLILSLVLIGQQASFDLYHVGFLLLIVSAIIQIGFGNVPPTADFKKSMTLLGVYLLIIAGVFVLGIILAPSLIRLARG